jgi:hypothetical protein
MGMSYKPLALVQTPVAVNIFGLQMNSELFRPQGRGLLSGSVVVVLGSKKGGTLGTNKAAIRDHLLHDFSSLSARVASDRVWVQVCLNLPDLVAVKQENAA